MYCIEDNIYIKDTGVYGKSLFAKHDYKKGDIVFVPFGPITKIATLYSIPVGYLNSTKDYIFIEPTIPEGNISQFICHSCEPNMGVKDRTLFVALRDIKKDEEVTIDYAMIVASFIHPTQGEVVWKGKKCLCGRKGCRGTVKGYFELSKDEKEKYKGYISGFIIDMEKEGTTHSVL